MVPGGAGNDLLDRYVALELVHATEAAAISAQRWIGGGDKNSADAAAVDAMREYLSTVDIAGRVVIGEGEKDAAPMLFNGELVGTGRGPALDIAVDPIDGTTLTAAGRPNALCVIAVSGRDTMLDASATFYMDKIVTDAAGRGVVHMDNTVAANVQALANAKGKPVNQIQVAVLDRPRHKALIDEIRSSGAITLLIPDGDVAAGINAAREGSAVDMALGVGGSPEGVLTACAVKALGGYMQVRLHRPDPLDGEAAGLSRIWEAEDLVQGPNALFIATGLTDGDLLRGVQRRGDRVRTESLILSSGTRTMRRVQSDHTTGRPST
ncbi:class II fructose-bisphosphatase [Arthrobacter sp. AK01]|uniref:class II fructose-bisphosphatase n=1 Tax=Arthrobacter sp. AK01 TaxID=2894084 RepID=UPI001E52DD65|nr:class II fructose-bisphosphatase [Arthrobacter sp. AK01]MCD4849687.1 class II fructose-bisphosphatase [Arthrobacter sp. AK01]